MLATNSDTCSLFEWTLNKADVDALQLLWRHLLQVAMMGPSQISIAFQDKRKVE